MPRTLLDKHARVPVDRPKALILERMAALDVTSEEMAACLGISRATWYRLMSQPSIHWPVGHLMDACRRLKVDAEDLFHAIRY